MTKKKSKDNILKFPKLQGKVSSDLIHLKNVSDHLDKVILESIDSGKLDIHELIGLVSHRLGTLLNTVKEKKQLWQVCISIIEKQAKIHILKVIGV